MSGRRATFEAYRRAAREPLAPPPPKPPKRCEHVAGDVVCGATPAVLYLPGPRCPAHTPAALLGLPEGPRP